MAPQTGECHAHNTDSQAECDCAKHHEVQDSSSEDEPDPPKNVLDIVLDAIPDASKAAAGKRRGGKIISTLFGQANQEANKGMRPPKSSDAGSSKKEKGKSKAEAQDNNIFKALGVVVVPDGVLLRDKTLTSLRTKVPDRTSVQVLVSQGLAVLNQNGFEFCRTWSHEELQDFLFSVLPNVFSYFKDLELDSGSPQWLLGDSECSKIKVVSIPQPTGFDVEYIAGQNRTGYRNLQVLIHTYSVLYQTFTDLNTEFLSFMREEDQPVDDVSTGDSRSPTPELGPLFPARQRNKRLVSILSDEEATSIASSSKRAKTLKASKRRWT
ncbi:hypothetical protein DFH07DRAFT_969676 [Mycena maculata]|uniref:Uncharacterized protein n=1 Tax=Mycena maculata TaxID=230809 RepID=A0AAD7MR34_9AGAR|nr:hypothetical protein DFH07DRAFT_969676 [Mycena maculata]